MLPAAALDILESSDRQRVLEHLPDCPECTRLLAEYRDVSAALPLLVPDRLLDADRSDALRSRLMTRVRGESNSAAEPPKTTAQSPVTRPTFTPAKWTGWLGWAVAAGLAGLLLVHHSVHRPVAYGWLAAGVLTFLVIALGVYVRIQQARLAALRERLTAEKSEERALQETSSGSHA